MSTIKLLPGMRSSQSLSHIYGCSVPGCDCSKAARADLDARDAQWAAEIERLTKERDDSRATNRRLNERCAIYESAIKKKVDEHKKEGRTLFRALALAGMEEAQCETRRKDAEIERLTELCAVIQSREIGWCSTAQTASRAATGAEAKIEDLRFALREVRSVLRTCQYDPGSAAPRTRSISNRRDGVLCDCRTCGPAATLDAALAGGSR
jgi:hypothetical protein